MQISRNDIILIITVLSGTFLIVGVFFLFYFTLYNKKKKRDFLKEMAMQEEFEQELVKTRLEVQEHTLKTISSDIHDNVGQLISITKLTLSSIPSAECSAKNLLKLNSAKELLDNAATELRQLASLLHAENILAAGLSHAVEREVNWLLKSGQLNIDYSVEGRPLQQLKPETALVAYRITQEILNNIIKHAQATDVIVKMCFEPTLLEVLISDNGKGFSSEKERAEPTGLGMKTLFHRANMIHADLQLHSENGKGTKAILKIPYQKNAAHAK